MIEAIIKGRTVELSHTTIGNASDHLTQAIHFTVPKVFEEQQVWIGYVRPDNETGLYRLDEDGVWHIGRGITAVAGKATAFVRIISAGEEGEVWNSNPFGLYVQNIPAVGLESLTDEPTALDAALMDIASYAQSAASDAQAAFDSAEMAQRTASQLTELSVVATEVSSDAAPAASYDAATGVLTLLLARGRTGEQGPMGDTGPQGPQGPQGERGPKGDPGEAVVRRFTAMIPSTGWANGAVTVAVDGLLASDTPQVDVVLSGTGDEEVLQDWCKVKRIVTAQNSMTVYATEALSGAVPVQMVCVR